MTNKEIQIEQQREYVEFYLTKMRDKIVRLWGSDSPQGVSIQKCLDEQRDKLEMMETGNE